MLHVSTNTLVLMQYSNEEVLFVVQAHTHTHTHRYMYNMQIEQNIISMHLVYNVHYLDVWNVKYRSSSVI